MFLEKDGIRIEMSHPADIARMKALGYQPVEKPAKAEAPKAEPPVADDLTPEQENAEAIDAVNKSKGTPKATRGGDK